MAYNHLMFEWDEAKSEANLKARDIHEKTFRRSVAP